MTASTDFLGIHHRPRQVLVTALAMIGLLGSMLVGISSAAPAPNPNVDVWEHYCNGGTTQCAGGDWISGNLGKSNSAYDEGDSVPFRLVIDPDGQTDPITVVITYDASRKAGGGTVAHDYLTSWNASETLDETLPSADLPILGAISSSFLIPLDPAITLPHAGWSGTPLAAGSRQMQAQNATITAIGISTDGNFASGSADSTTTITVTVNPGGAIPGTTPFSLLFGAHVSSPLDWSIPTASSVSGSPYHVTAVSPSGGDLSMSADAVIPFTQISVLKRLAAAQSWAGANPVPGETVVYEIVATNAGNIAGTVNITDTLSGAGAAIAGLTSMKIGATDCTGGTLTAGDDSGTCSAVSVPPNGGTTTVTVVATIESIATGQYCNDLTLTNVATASANVTTGTVNVTIDVPTCTASISAVKTVNTPADKNITVGAEAGVVIYEVVITNTGFAAATGVSVSDLVADNPDFDSLALYPTLADAQAETNALANPASVDVPAKAFGGADGTKSVWVRGEVTLPAAGETCTGYDLDNTAKVDGTGYDAAAVTVTPIPCASSLSAAKTVITPADKNITVGAEAGVVIYEVVITNTGFAAATGVSVSDLVADNPDFDSLALYPTLADAQAETNALANPALVDVPAKTFGGANGTKSVWVRGEVTLPAAGETCAAYDLDNTAKVDGTGYDAATVTVTPIPCASSLSAAKNVLTPADGDIEVGTDDGVVIYEVVITNTGFAAATDVSVSDLVADNADFSSGSLALYPTLADAQAETNALANPALVDVPAKTFGGADGTKSVWVRGEVTLPAAGETCAAYDLDNTAKVDGTGYDAATVTVTPITCVPSVTPAKVLIDPSDGQIDAATHDGIVVYKITLTNTGYAAATNWFVSDTITDNPDFESLTLHASQADAENDANSLGDAVNGINVPAKTFNGADGVVTFWVRGELDLPEVGETCDPYDVDNTATIGEVRVSSDEYDAATVTVTPVPCAPGVSMIKYVSGDQQNWMDANTPGSGPTLTLPATAFYKVDVTNTGNVNLYHVDLVDYVDPLELDEDGFPLEWDNEPFSITGDCLQDIGTEDEDAFDGSLAPGETISCFFDQLAVSGEHFDVVTLVACFPDVLCDEQGSEDQGSEDQFQTASVRPAGNSAFLGGWRRAAAVLPVIPTVRLGAADPAYLSAAFPIIIAPVNVDAPSVDLSKVGSTSTASIGDTVQYRYTVTNNGNVTLTNVTLVDVVDTTTGQTTVTIASAADGITLAPGASRDFFTTHTVTADDVGQILNTATVTATAGTATLTDTDDWVVAVGADPGLSIVKTADDDFVTFSASGATETIITYTYVVTNTGDVTISGITVVDDILGAIDLPTTTLAPGESVTGTATHTVTQADADAGFIINVAVASGTDPTGDTVEATDTAEVGVTEVLGVIEERPDPLPAPEPQPEPLPEVAPEVIPATGADSSHFMAIALLLLASGMLTLESERAWWRRRRQSGSA